MSGEVSAPEKDLSWYRAELDTCRAELRVREDHEVELGITVEMLTYALQRIATYDLTRRPGVTEEVRNVRCLMAARKIAREALDVS